MAENVLGTACEGAAILYSRGDLIRGKIHYRLKVPGLEGTYERKSTGYTDLKAATRVVEKRYAKLMYEHENLGRTAMPRSFAAVADEYLADIEAQSKVVDSSGKPRVPTQRVITHRSMIKNTLKQHFGKLEIDGLKESDLEAYRKWRRSVPKKLKPKKRHKPSSAATMTVSDNTIVGELSCCRAILTYSVKNGYMDRSRIPTHGWGSLKANPRPAFTDIQVEGMPEAFNAWAREGRDKMTRYRRRRLKALTLVGAWSGCRGGELKSLRWKQCVLYDGKYDLFVDGKTGRRQVDIMQPAHEALVEWKQVQAEYFDAEPTEDDFVFMDVDREQLRVYEHTFNEFLKYAGMTHSVHNEPLVFYSLRHFWATNRLEHGVSVYLVAQNMGTGVDKIEAYYGHVKNDALRSELNRGKRENAWKSLSDMVEEAKKS